MRTIRYMASVVLGQLKWLYNKEGTNKNTRKFMFETFHEGLIGT